MPVSAGEEDQIAPEYDDCHDHDVPVTCPRRSWMGRPNLPIRIRHAKCFVSASGHIV